MLGEGDGVVRRLRPGMHGDLDSPGGRIEEGLRDLPAVRVLSTVRGEMSDDERDAFEAPIIDDYEREGSPWYSTARLWDDGVIDPRDTRKLLALGLAAAAGTGAAATTYGVFRM